MKALLIVLGALEAISLAGVLVLIVRHFPSNHLAFDVRSLYLIAALGLFLSFLYWSKTHSRQASLFILLNLLFTAAIAFIDLGNILVDYDVWVSRGMPETFSFGAKR